MQAPGAAIVCVASALSATAKLLKCAMVSSASPLQTPAPPPGRPFVSVTAVTVSTSS